MSAMETTSLLRLDLGLLGLRLAVPLLGGLLGLLGGGRRLRLEPRHPRAQLLADRLDRMVEVALEELLIDRAIGLVLEHPLAGELARADLLEDLLHLGLHVVVHDARA